MCDILCQLQVQSAQRDRQREREEREREQSLDYFRFVYAILSKPAVSQHHNKLQWIYKNWLAGVTALPTIWKEYETSELNVEKWS